MFTLKEEKLFYNDRPALVRDLVIDEEILKEIEFDEGEDSFNKNIVIDGMLIYVIKYKESASPSLVGKWHLAFQSLNEGKMVYLYESYNIYLGD